MKDWIFAILLGMVVLVVITTGALLSVLLTPIAIFVVVVFGIWFLLQILKEGDHEENDGGPKP